jgi:Gpi18-like mannosyltransferase
MSVRATEELPRWAGAFDIAGVALLLIAVSVLVTGGFHELTPLGRLSVTSWIRPSTIGAALLILRHVLHRKPSLASRIVSSAEAWRASAESRVVWPIFLSTRVGVLIVGFLGVALVGYAPNTPPWRAYDNDFFNLPARWDTGWYLGIAEHGYQWDPAGAAHMQNIAFFPAYPMLIRYGSLFLARQRLLAAEVVSFVAFFFALIYLFRFAKSRIGDEAAATTVALLAAYPFALFYSAAYTESLFLLTAIAACYRFERDELWPAGLWGLAAGLARPNGCLLSVVLALIALRAYKTTPHGKLAARIAVAAMPGIGMVIFSIYIYSLTGHPLQWAAQHAAFGRVYRSIDALVDDRIKYIEANGLYNYVTVLCLDLLNAIPIVFAFASLWPVYRRFGAPYAAMILVNVALPLLMGGVLSMGRVTCVLFPIFLWLGAAIPARHRSGWLIGFAMVQALFAVAFFTWRPLY